MSRRLWFPHQHGAWAMLALPLLLGIAATRPVPWDIPLGIAAVSGYLASATAQAWLRARRRPSFMPSLVAYLLVAALSGAVLVIRQPALLASGLVIVPAGLVAIGGAKPGTRRDLANSLAQTAIALVLVPAAAVLGGVDNLEPVVAATLVATAYLVGVVLVVRSVIRERDDPGFIALSIGWHLLAVAVAMAFLAPAYVLVALFLAARAAALPLLARRRAGTRRALRPVHVGAVEIVASVLLVLVAFASPPGLA